MTRPRLVILAYPCSHLKARELIIPILVGDRETYCAALTYSGSRLTLRAEMVSFPMRTGTNTLGKQSLAPMDANRIRGIRDCPHFLTGQANPSTYETLDKHVILGYPRNQ